MSRAADDFRCIANQYHEDQTIKVMMTKSYKNLLKEIEKEARKGKYSCSIYLDRLPAELSEHLKYLQLALGKDGFIVNDNNTPDCPQYNISWAKMV